MFEEVTLAQKTEEKLRLIQSDIKRHISEMHQQADKNRKELSSIYSYLRDLILERETTLKRQISENLTKDEQDGDQKLYEMSEFTNMIQSLKQELVNQSQENEIEVLQKSKARSQMFAEVNGPRAKELSSFNINVVASQCMSLTEIKREQELGQVSKLINPAYKGPAVVSSFGQPASSSSLYSHTKSSQMKRGGTTVQNGPPNLNNQVQSFQQQPLQNQLVNPPLEKKESQSNKQNKSGANTNNVKQKVSPHRAATKKTEPSLVQAKKQGVVILDQNKNQKGNVSNLNNKQKAFGGFP